MVIFAPIHNTMDIFITPDPNRHTSILNEGEVNDIDLVDVLSNELSLLKCALTTYLNATSTSEHRFNYNLYVLFVSIVDA